MLVDRRIGQLFTAADLIAELLGCIFHVTTGQFDDELYSESIGHSANLDLWLTEDRWKITQAGGVSTTKFGSLVVQRMHAPTARYIQTPFIGHPFKDLKLTPYKGGVASLVLGSRSVGVCVSALAEEHDELIAAMLLAYILDPSLELTSVYISERLEADDLDLLASIAKRLKVPHTVSGAEMADYCFNFRSRTPEIALELFDGLSLCRPDSDKNAFIATTLSRPIGTIYTVGATIYKA